MLSTSSTSVFFPPPNRRCASRSRLSLASSRPSRTPSVQGGGCSTTRLSGGRKSSSFRNRLRLLCLRLPNTKATRMPPKNQRPRPPNPRSLRPRMTPSSRSSTTSTGPGPRRQRAGESPPEPRGTPWPCSTLSTDLRSTCSCSRRRRKRRRQQQQQRRRRRRSSLRCRRGRRRRRARRCPRCGCSELPHQPPLPPLRTPRAPRPPPPLPPLPLARRRRSPRRGPPRPPPLPPRPGAGSPSRGRSRTASCSSGPTGSRCASGCSRRERPSAATAP
jgi:hypothetical protein